MVYTTNKNRDFGDGGTVPCLVYHIISIGGFIGYIPLSRRFPININFKNPAVFDSYILYSGFLVGHVRGMDNHGLFSNYHRLYIVDASGLYHQYP